MRAISNMMAALILIAIVAFAGIMLFFMTTGFFRGAGKATMSLSASGMGSADGARATVNLVIQNTGDGAGKVVGIYVAPETHGAEVDEVKSVGFNVADAKALEFGEAPTTLPNFESQGEILDAKASRTAMLHITGKGLYAGAQLRIYIAYYDMASEEVAVTETVVTLR